MNTEIYPDEVLFWQSIKHFKAIEFGTDFRKVDRDLIILMDRYRQLLGVPVKIHCAYATDGHSPKSQHYKGLACDCSAKGVSVLDQYLAAEQIGFKGIGLYPFWNNKGLHLDIRTGKPIRWFQDKAGKYVYCTKDELTSTYRHLFV